MAHVLMDHRHGLPVDVQITAATGYAERQAALQMLDRLPNRAGRRTVAGDKAYDTADFAEGCRERGVTAHVACNDGRPLRKMKVTGRAKVGFMATLTVSCYALLRVANLLRPLAMAPA